jgi:aromatic ring-cleaving dioxygenase
MKLERGTAEMSETSDRPAVPAKDPGTITEYHAHVYYDSAASRRRAERLRERVAAEFPLAKLGRWHDEMVGPHPQSMYQIAFPNGMLTKFVPWLMLNRDGLTVLPLRLEVFKKK